MSSCLSVMVEAIQDKLTAWARGRAIDDPPNGYPGHAAFAPLMHRRVKLIRDRGERAMVPNISDNEQALIDREVAAMRLTKPDHYMVICLCYLYHLPDGRIGRRMGRGRTWARETRRAAEHYLEARLL